MLNLIIWIVVGAILGWIASIIMKTNSRQGLIGDILVGIVGAFLAGRFLSPLFGVGTINQGDFSIPALLVSLAGAVLVLVISKLFRHISGFLFIVLLALLAYLYVTCWMMESSADYCAGIRALPFLN